MKDENFGRCYALVLAQVALLNCRVAGMQAANQHRIAHGSSIAYSDDAFFAVEREFEARITKEVS